MKKTIKLAVLLGISNVTVFAPLSTALADMGWMDGKNYIDKHMNDIRKKMDEHFASFDFTKPSAPKKSPPTPKHPQQHHHHHHHHYYHHPQQQHHHHHHLINHTKPEQSKQHIEKHHSSHLSYNHSGYQVDHRRKEQSKQHIEHKTYNYVERKKTTHHHIHTNLGTRDNSGDALAAGILGLAAGAILGKAFQKAEQPQIIYQQAPQHQVVYQQAPQKQVVYEVPSIETYQPLQQTSHHNWLQYCKKKYRSFNPKTGTFRGNDGLDHFCYAPLN
ncbi:BA14K family protein [Bartonella florencae]|uniref:BA14K family protein n=1 Tax=Bartonella florencae TaxID=928210 RepID=UPI0002ECE553|nr:BA14K family protein [Bartonella florencae]